MAPDHSQTSEIAVLIRTRRIVQGMSQARLGAAVDRTATTVRRWERGESVPPDDALEGLATALEIPREQLTAAVAASTGEPVAAPEPDRVIPQPFQPDAEPDDEDDEVEGDEEDVSADSMPIVVAAAAAPAGPRQVIVDADVGSDTPDVEVRPTLSESDAAASAGPAAAAAAVGVVPMALVHADEPGAAAADVLDVGDDGDAVVGGETASVGTEGQPWIELPTEAIFTPIGGPDTDDGPEGEIPVEPAAAAPPPRRVAAAAATAPAPTAPQVVLVDKSYIEDRWERVLYGLRVVLTVVALGVMAVVLAWAVLELFDALQAVLDLFGDAADTPPDEVVESLGAAIASFPW